MAGLFMLMAALFGMAILGFSLYSLYRQRVAWIEAGQMLELQTTAPSLGNYGEMQGELDGVPKDAPLVLDREAMETALESIAPSDRELLERTAARIKDFAQAQRDSLGDLARVSEGVEMGHRISAVPAAGS